MLIAIDRLTLARCVREARVLVAQNNGLAVAGTCRAERTPADNSIPSSHRLHAASLPARLDAGQRTKRREERGDDDVG